MPFDPIIHRCEPLASIKPCDAEDADLPRDLAALGDQLRDDAARLAARYPVNTSNAVASVASRRSVPWVHVAAASLVLAAGIGFALAMRPTGDALRPVTVDRIVQADNSTHPPATEISDRVLDASEAYLLAADTNAAAGLIVPAVLFHNLSGPEQEGLLDLLDEIVPEAIDLSM